MDDGIRLGRQGDGRPMYQACVLDPKVTELPGMYAGRNPLGLQRPPQKVRLEPPGTHPSPTFSEGTTGGPGNHIHTRMVSGHSGAVPEGSFQVDPWMG